MNTLPDAVRRYRSAQARFLRPALINFFAHEFPRFFGPLMRERIADEILGLFEAMVPQSNRIKPGQLLWNALDQHTRGDSPNRRFVPVILSLITEEDVKQLAHNVPMSHIARKAIARIIREAYVQGGILSSRDIGLLTLRHPTNVSALRQVYEQENDCTLPHTGALHDMGSCISHKAIIVWKVVVEKKDPAAVAKECNHTQRAVDRYLKDYYRVKTAYEYRNDIDYIHSVTGLAKHVVRQYIDIINREKNT